MKRLVDWLLGPRCTCGQRVYANDMARHVARGHWGW